MDQESGRGIMSDKCSNGVIIICVEKYPDFKPKNLWREVENLSILIGLNVGWKQDCTINFRRFWPKAPKRI